MIYTTRPIRDGEENGREYFVDENKSEGVPGEMKLSIRGQDLSDGLRPTYFTADDGQVSVGNDSYLGIGTLESFRNFGVLWG